MIFYKKDNVFDAALKRMERLFDEFPNVIVGFSGGKDSTVTLNLALKVAEQKNRLPLKVLFLDQEAEWQSVIDYVQSVMEDPRVEPMWFQMELRLFNSTSTDEPWLKCWEDGKEHMRDRWHKSISVNKYGSDRFAELFEKIVAVEYSNTKTCYLAGVRCEESPTRFVALTSAVTYKDITYGKILNKKKQHFTFYPLYDWSYTDIWKAIHDNDWEYCKIYNYMYQHGIDVKKMRVSNVHHETSVASLFYLQEIEGETWNKLTKRIKGINAAGQLKEKAFFITKELPFMFKNWKEYRDYLLENLISDIDIKNTFEKKFKSLDEKYALMHHKEVMYKNEINTILANDYHFTKITNWERTPEVNDWRMHQKGKFHKNQLKNKYVTG